MLAFRLAAPAEKQKKELDVSVGTLKEQYQETAQRAEKDKVMRAKRCFDAKYKDGQKQCIRWILAAPAHLEFMHAMNVMKQTKIMEAVRFRCSSWRLLICPLRYNDRCMVRWCRKLELFRSCSSSKVVDIPFVPQKLFPMVLVVRKTMETPQLQFVARWSMSLLVTLMCRKLRTFCSCSSSRSLTFLS